MPLTKDQQTILNRFGPQAQSKIDLALATSGPGILTPPEERIMTGAVSPAHGTEQAGSVSGQDPTRPIAEDGKSKGKGPRVFSPGGRE